uniref:Uncharacterized protein n=1 Tax=Glossina brevipalpis TaxID=37001 RepID=A0A1A9WYE5_9MUSC
MPYPFLLRLYEMDSKQKGLDSAMDFRGVGNVNETSRGAVLVCSTRRCESGNSDKSELESQYAEEDNRINQDLNRWQQQRRQRYCARLKSRHEEVCLYANTLCDQSVAKMTRKQSFSSKIFKGIWNFHFNIPKDFIPSTENFAREESKIQYSALDYHITYEPFDYDEAGDVLNNTRCNVSCAKIRKWRRSISQITAMCKANNATLLPFVQCVQKIHKLIHFTLLILLMLTQVVRETHATLLDTNFTQSDLALLIPDSTSDLTSYSRNYSNSSQPKINVYSEDINSQFNGNLSSFPSSKGVVVSPVSGNGYLEKLDSLERSLAAVLIKVAYGTTSTTKRSIPDNSNVPSLTTIATPLLTTLRYQEKTLQQSQLNLHHRNYELDLERDHALPTSAPNADILKSNNNPTYPNPNRHHSHDRDKHRHLLNSTPVPSLPNVLKRTNGQPPTIPMFSGDVPSYSPPARSFFTPPLPPEYQHPFADKPTLRGTSNEGAVILNAGTFINRRPIPPPSLMPGHERIPFRPPDLTVSNSDSGQGAAGPSSGISTLSSTVSPLTYFTTAVNMLDIEHKKALNTPSKGNYSLKHEGVNDNKPVNPEGVINYDSYNGVISNPYTAHHDTRKEVLPSIRRILSGSNGRKGDIPEVLLKQVTSRPNHQSSSSPMVLIDSTIVTHNGNETQSYSETSSSNSNINISINMKTLNDGEFHNNNEDYNSDHQKTRILSKPASSDSVLTGSNSVSSTPSAAAAIEGNAAVASAVTSPATSTTVTFSGTDFSFPDKTGSSRNEGTTALLFVLLATLQIFGAISISTTRPLIAQTSSEIDWLQWGYQFSLRLIEIAIITLISWVTGLKNSGGGGGVNIGLTNGGTQLAIDGQGGGNNIFGSTHGLSSTREKQGTHQHLNHSNVAGFFLPCTSSSSQEQFETDYPVVCNANTNLHTYTMRTGKLIYDDSFALNSLGNTNGVPITDVQHSPDIQLQQPAYQHPYEDGSMHSSVHHNISECDSRFHHEQPQYSDYLTDNTTDHYENPNFDLINSESAASANGLLNNTNSGDSVNKKFGKTSTTSTTALSSNESNSGSHSASAASAVSQQQMLLLQSDTCYSEPCQQNYDFNNFERPQFNGPTQKTHEHWSDSRVQIMFNNKREQKKSFNTLDRCGYDKPERRSDNSAYSCNSNTGHDQRYPAYNSFERGSSRNGVRKSETFNNIAGNTTNAIHGRNASSSSAASSTSCGPRASSGVQTLTTGERHHHHNFQSHNSKGLPRMANNHINQRIPNSGQVVDVFGRPFERTSMKTSQNSMVNGSSNIKSALNLDEVLKTLGNQTEFQFLPHRTTLSGMMPTAKKLALIPIYFPSSNHPPSLPSSPQNVFGLTRNKRHLSSFESSRYAYAINEQLDHLSSTNSGITPISYVSDSAYSSSMLVAEHGFVRFRPLDDDVNNAEDVGIHHASLRNNDQISK